MSPPTPNDMPQYVTKRDNLEACEDSLRLFGVTVVKNTEATREDLRQARDAKLTIWTMIHYMLLRPTGPDARHIHISRDVAFTLFKGGILTPDNFRYPSRRGQPYVQCRGQYVRAVITINGRDLLCDIYEVFRPGIQVLDSNVSSNGAL